MASDISVNATSWQDSMKLAIRDGEQLLSELGLSDVELASTGKESFPVFVPREYLSRIRRGDATDPLLLQVLPQPSEDLDATGFTRDPVGDSGVEVVPGILHKYQGRVLLIVSGACAIHCRYCFRRHYPYQSAPKSLAQWKSSLEYIENDTSISEIILSGGDPLTVVDPLLSDLVGAMETLPHVKRLRIHTRLPVVIPSRVTPELCSLLERSRFAVWIVLHINHANEIDDDVEQAIVRLRRAGCNVLNQAVLLKGVNDTEEAMIQLLERLIDCQVMPYYINQLDRVVGASHFEVDVEYGKSLLDAARKRLPGYAIPLYVQDQTLESNGLTTPASKTPL